MSTTQTSGGPAWLEEVLDVLAGRRTLVLGVAVAASLVGVVGAVLLPDLLPATPLVGAAVGLAACLLAVAAAVAIDAGDPTVRGARHVRAAGANLVSTVSGSEPTSELVTWAEGHIRDTDGLRLALASAGGSAARVGELTDALGGLLASRGWRVLIVDLSREHSNRAGAAEVCRAEVRLSQAVELHPTLNLARLGSGRGLDTALEEFPALAARLPRDVDVLLVALPGLRRTGVLPAAAAADRALAVVDEGATTRVDLIAALDALDEARVPTDVLLAREYGAPGLVPPAPVASVTELPREEPADIADDDTTEVDLERTEAMEPVTPPEPSVEASGAAEDAEAGADEPVDEPTAEAGADQPLDERVDEAADEPLDEPTAEARAHEPLDEPDDEPVAAGAEEPPAAPTATVVAEDGAAAYPGLEDPTEPIPPVRIEEPDPPATPFTDRWSAPTERVPDSDDELQLRLTVSLDTLASEIWAADDESGRR